MKENEIPATAFVSVTPNCAQVILTVAAVPLTATATLVPQVVAAQVPQFFGLPAESVLGAIVLGVATCIESPTVPVPLETGPMVPETVKDIPV